MSQILRVAGNSGWAARLEELEIRMDAEPMSARPDIAQLFGGMGSLNDVVIYIDGRPPTRENDEFDNLRTELFKLIVR